MYNNQIANALFCPIGAFVCWLFKGLKGDFGDQFNDKKEERNKWIGILTLAIVVSIVGIIKNIYDI
ncbi:MAG: hypothetical protein V4511_07045 [Bacteroidota bacterium]